MKKVFRIALSIAVLAICFVLAITVFKFFVKIIVPILLILAMFMILISLRRNNDNKTVTVVFSGSELDFSGENFTGGKFTAIFGGIDCNLKTAIIEDGAVVNVNAIFGGVDVIVPAGINVKVNSTSIFGGVSNKTSSFDGETNTLYINAVCIFGGVDIK